MHPGIEMAPGHAQAHGSLYSSPAPPPIHAVSPMNRPYSTSYTPPNQSLNLKLEDINKRLRQHPEFADRWWWEQFACEFFDDNATMVVSFDLSMEGHKNFTIGRAMIPQYFSSIFEGGVTEMYHTLSFPREYMTAAGPTLECDSTVVTTQYAHPSYARVLVESRLSVHSAFDEGLRIRSWHQHLIRHKEYIPRDVLNPCLQDSGTIDALSRNITLLGLNGCTLNFLNVSAIADSVANDVKRVGYGMPPGDCMQSWSTGHPEPAVPTSCMMSHPAVTQPLGPSMCDFSQSPVLSSTTDSLNSSDRVAVTKSPKPAKKQKRARKGTTTKESSIPPKKTSKSNITGNSTPTMPCPPMPQDVMVVGEPVLMNEELGKEDERCITRLENNNSNDFLATGQHPAIIPTMYNGNGDNNDDLGLGNGHGGVYDEPSITAALDALEQDDPTLSVP